MNLNLANLLRQLAAIAGIVVTTTNSLHLPTNVRATLLAVSGGLLAVEHAIAPTKGPKP